MTVITFKEKERRGENRCQNTKNSSRPSVYSINNAMKQVNIAAQALTTIPVLRKEKIV